jgi:glycine hydroxymethyltransferase
VTSGIRLGTSALTTRGFGVAEMDRVAELLDTVLTKRDDATVGNVKKEVRELTDAFPLYVEKRKRVGVG